MSLATATAHAQTTPPPRPSPPVSSPTSPRRPQPRPMSESPPRLSPGLMSKVARQLNGHASQPSEPKNTPGSPKQNGDLDDNDISTPSGSNAPDDLARDASSPDSRSLGDESLDSDHNMSSDPAGSEHSSETEEIDYIADLRRVKVYELVDLQWEDRGTAFCTGDFDDNAQEAKIVAKSEANPDQVLLQHTIRGHDVYQRQQETLIVWTETDGTDYALSFQDVEGCAEVWEFIGEVQRHLNGKGEGATSSPPIGPEPTTSTQIIQSGRLPQPSLGVIKEVEHAIKALARSSTAKGRVCEYIINKNYVKQMIDVFSQAEDLESIEDLHALCSCMQAILLLNDHMIYEYVMTDELFDGVCGILEYDPEFPTHKACYRDFLKDTSQFRPVIEFQDEAMQKKIHQTYRLQFLKDVVLSRAIDDTTFNVLNSCIIFNQIDIISHIQQDDVFLKALVGMFVDVRWWNTMGINGRVVNRFPSGSKNGSTASQWNSRSPTPADGSKPGQSSKPPTTDAQRRDVIFLVQQLCVMGKNVQLPARLALYRAIVEHGVLHALQWALAHGSEHEDRLLTSTAGEILTLLIEHDTAGTRSHVLRQITSKAEVEKDQAVGKEPTNAAGLRGTEPLLGEMIRVLTGSHEWALKSQMADALRIMLDSPTEAQGLLTALRALRPKDDPNHDQFLDNFYKGWVSDLFQPLLRDVPEFKDLTVPLLKFTKDQANLYLYLCDLLSAFILQHSFRSQIFLFTSKLHLRVASLLRAKDKHVRLAAVRFFRACMKIDNQKINMMFDEQEVFQPILEFTVREARRDNLLSSAAQELFDYIRRENRKDVIRGLVTRHQALIQKLVALPSTGERFRNLILKHEMNVEPPPPPDEGSTTQKRTLDAMRIAEMEEEDYFNSDDGPSTPLSKAQAQVSAANNMLKRKRLRGNTIGASSRSTPRGSPAPLVDYDEEEEPSPDDATPDAGPSTESRPSPSPSDDAASTSGQSTSAVEGAADTSVSLGPRPSVKRRRTDEEDEDDGLARLVSRKRQALSSDDEDDLVGGAGKPVAGVKREEGAKKLKLVLALKTAESSHKDEKMKDDGG
ncbi:DUF625-domain-containing protein [Exidia glandulosa HHB12029]|uniref:DUF625-domain-containing protein n=1 Tax=Exidia glandulosa HHB12029 TaxID=1314781 RepID=A0A166BTZ7_EXIGL|nr:DUF625-domain-containing protein [Exidia glandulosa HHB12029]